MTFEKWLKEQKHRKDSIGELARSMDAPKNKKDIGREMVKVLDLAYKEYKGSI
jgi:hypothetical protein